MRARKTIELSLSMSRRYTVACLAGTALVPSSPRRRAGCWRSSRGCTASRSPSSTCLSAARLWCASATACRSGRRATSAVPMPSWSRRRVSPRFNWSKSALGPVCSLTRVAHGSQSTLVIGPTAAGGSAAAIREAFLLAARRRARVSSVGDTDCLERPRRRRGRSRRARHRGSAPLASAKLWRRSARGSCSIWSRPTTSCTARSAMRSQHSRGPSTSPAAVGFRSSPGLFAPAGVVDPTVAGYGVVDPAAMLLAVSLLLAAGSARAARPAKTLERAIVAGTDWPHVVARRDDQNIYRCGDRSTAGKPYRCRTRG